MEWDKLAPDIRTAKRVCIMKSIKLVCCLALLVILAMPAQAAVKTARSDLIGTWKDYSDNSEVLKLNGTGTGIYLGETDITWQYNTSQAVLTLYAPDSNTTYTIEIMSEAHARMTVSWTSNNDTLQVLTLDTVDDVRANFSESDLINTYQFNTSIGGATTKVKLIFYSDGYGEQRIGSASTGTTFTWTYTNPMITITGTDIKLADAGDGMRLNGLGSDYKYTVVLFNAKLLTVLTEAGVLVVLSLR